MNEHPRAVPAGYVLDPESGEYCHPSRLRGRALLQTDTPGAPSELERIARHGALGALQIQKGIGGRFLVRVTAVRCRLLDEDNLCEKYHVDLCRYAGILPQDSPGTAKIEVCQRKADPGEQEAVTVEVFRI